MAVFPTIHPDRLAPGSFQQPVSVPTLGPRDGHQIQVCFNEDWLPYVLGCLLQLTLSSTWNVTTQADLNAAFNKANDLILLFQKFIDCDRSVPGAGASEDLMLRQDPTNPCLLQSSVDGVTWCTWADLSKCNPQVTQPGDGTPQPAPGGGCQTYHVVLSANDKWLLPAPVNSGDTITVTNAKGAWNDGTVSPWQCPDGNTFFAGACLGVGGGTSGGDPAPALNHMSLIAGIGATFFGVLAGPVTIPGGVVFGMLEFQANDSILSDNLGSIEFDVQICNNQTGTWSHAFDFLTSADGWVPLAVSGAAPSGAYVPGSGWTTSDVTQTGGATFRRMYLERDFAATEIDSIQVTFDLTKGTYDNPAADYGLLVGINTISDTHEIDQFASALVDGNGQVKFGSTPVPGATKMQIYLASSDTAVGGAFSGAARLYKVVVTGKGTDPF